MTKPLCADIEYSPDIFFYLDDQERPKNKEKDAVLKEYLTNLCDACPLKQQCLEVALNQKDVYGWWAGTTRADRRKIKREQALKKE